jgi:hypothetical protein
VRDEHDRAPELAVHLGEKFHDLLTADGVKLAGWLVGQHQLRTRRQRSRNRDALLLTARKPAGNPVGERGQPESREQFVRGLARRPGGKGHVLPDGRVGQQVARGVLQDERHDRPPQPGE